jgi:hypothetical protein
LRVSVISLNHGLSCQWQSDTMKLSAFTEIMNTQYMPITASASLHVKGNTETSDIHK